MLILLPNFYSDFDENHYQIHYYHTNTHHQHIYAHHLDKYIPEIEVYRLCNNLSRELNPQLFLTVKVDENLNFVLLFLSNLCQNRWYLEKMMLLKRVAENE